VFSKILSRFRATLFPEAPAPVVISQRQRDILSSKVSFYSTLNATDQALFEQRCLAFIYHTEFIGHNLEVTDADRMLIASGSVILAWGFEQWHYVKVDTVYLVPSSFNDSSEFRRMIPISPVWSAPHICVAR